MDRRDYHKKYRRGQRETWYKLMKDIGFGSCSICGYSKCMEALDFHHKNPNDKEKGMAIITNSTFTKESLGEFLNEIDKCIVVCANCHREIHTLKRR